jgi:hypothetical protein
VDRTHSNARVKKERGNFWAMSHALWHEGVSKLTVSCAFFVEKMNLNQLCDVVVTMLLGPIQSCFAILHRHRRAHEKKRNICKTNIQNVQSTRVQNDMVASIIETKQK